MNVRSARRAAKRSVRRVGKSLLLRIPPVRRSFRELQRYRRAFRHVPPGHFYSPMPSVDDVKRDADRLVRPTAPHAFPGSK